MPRNGQGVYSLPPVYEAVTGETIEAQQHNVPLEDIAADLNQPRSVATGGTGGGSAQQARENLSLYSKAETDQKIEGLSSGAPEKTTPVDADGVLISDSADSGKPKRVLWSKIKAIVNLSSVGAAIAAANGKTSPADGDFFAGVEAGGSTMFKTTWANIKAALQSLFDSRYYPKTGGILSGDIQIRKNLPGVYLSSPDFANVYRIFANVSDTVDGGVLLRRVAGDVAIADFGLGGFALDGYGNIRARLGYVVYSGSAFLANDGNINGSIWSPWGASTAFQAISSRIESRAQAWAIQEGAAQTQTYLMSSTYPIGTYLFGIKSSGGGVSTYGTIAGTDVDFSNAASVRPGGIGVGTWMVVGAIMTSTQASLLKRVG